LSICASSSRIGTRNASIAGSEAASPVRKSESATLDLWSTVSHAAARTGIHMLSRVNERMRIAANHGISQRRPRSSTSTAEASAAVSSARPQLSVSG
jgi:hypothetical protein